MGLKHDQNRARAMQQIDAVRAMAQTGTMGAIIWYNGLTAQEMYNLQIAARKVGIVLKVIRNRLAQQALQDTPFACFQPVLNGPVLLAFAQQSPGELARLLRDFSKDHNKLVVKYLAFEKELIPASDLDTMARLPTKEEAIAQLLFVLKEPVYQLLRVLESPQSQLLRALLAIKKD